MKYDRLDGNPFHHWEEIFDEYLKWIEGRGNVNKACLSMYDACRTLGPFYVHDIIWSFDGYCTWPKIVEFGPRQPWYFENVIDLYLSEEEREKGGEHFRMIFR